MIETNELIEESLFDLINGEFDPDDEALEMVVHLIGKKINFHGKQDFSSQIRFGVHNEHSLQRIRELKETRESIKEIFERAKAENQRLRITSTISISPVQS